MADANFRGGLRIVVEGIVTAVKVKNDKDKKPTNDRTVEVAWFGGSGYYTLANPAQAAQVGEGVTVRGECPAKTFKDSMYAGPITITHVDGKPVSGGAKLAG